MLISHLIRELKAAKDKFGDVAVETEGCDCVGSTFAVCKNWSDPGVSVMICREPFHGPHYDNDKDTPEPFEKTDGDYEEGGKL
jgi:hypothetical protein